MNSLGILNQMFSAYPNTPISEEGIVVYVRLLQDIPTADLQTVVDQAIATFKFPPTIAEIRDMYHGLQHVDQLSWTEAWETVQKEIRRIGSWGVPQFTDSLTTRVVQAMGWKTLCASDNPGTDRAQFRDMYVALAGRQTGEQKLLPQARELADRNGGMLTIRQLLEMAPKNDNH
jgi:hypothetical protein